MVTTSPTRTGPSRPSRPAPPPSTGPCARSCPPSADPAPAMRDRRPALDGLRAAAVAAVVLYHLNAPALPGGFLGVDLFFVLSGYLITGLLLRSAEHGPIDLPAFWVRRARRLLP